jgi:hypothetical protein
MIGDGLTKGMKVVGHALLPATVVIDVEVVLLEEVEPSVELKNMGHAVAKELALECEPHPTCGFYLFPNDLVELEGEGVKDPCHCDAIQPGPIDGHISDIGEEVVVQGVSTKREKHEVAPPLVVGQRGF